MSIREELQTIYSKHQQLTSSLVVKAATPKKHPLHNHFEWDDSIAGPKYREVQAAHMIRSVKIVRVEEDTVNECREWVHIVKGGDSHYDHIEEVARDHISTEIVLRQMEREWKQLKRKYDTFAEFIEMIRKDIAA